MNEKEFEKYKEGLKELNHTIDLAHLKNMVRELSCNQRLKFNLRKSPLHKKTPAEVSDIACMALNEKEKT